MMPSYSRIPPVRQRVRNQRVGQEVQFDILRAGTYMPHQPVPIARAGTLFVKADIRADVNEVEFAHAVFEDLRTFGLLTHSLSPR